MEKQTILFIEIDDETRNVIKANLQRDGYHVVAALDEEDARERASGGRLHPDLILIDLDAPPLEVLDVARDIRRQAELPEQTPIAVISCEFPPELDGKDVAVSATEYVSYMNGDNPLCELLRRLLKTKATNWGNRVESFGDYPPQSLA